MKHVQFKGATIAVPTDAELRCLRDACQVLSDAQQEELGDRLFWHHSNRTLHDALHRLLMAADLLDKNQQLSERSKSRG